MSKTGMGGTYRISLVFLRFPIPREEEDEKLYIKYRFTQHYGEYLCGHEPTSPDDMPPEADEVDASAGDQ